MKILNESNESGYRIRDGRLLYYMGNSSKIVIPNGVTNVAFRAFAENDNITSVEFPDTIQQIDNEAFASCNNLQTVTINSKKDLRIESNAFKKCVGLQSVSILGKVKYIASTAFYKCEKLTNVELSDTITEIQSSAFEDCKSLTNIRLPKSLEKLEPNVFKGCSNLTSVNLSELSSLKEVWGEAFAFTNLREIILPNGVKRLNSSFQDCPVRTIILTGNITAPHIAERCSNLNLILFKDGSVDICGVLGGNVIATDCDNLQTLVFDNNCPPKLSSNVFDIPSLKYIVTDYIGLQQYINSNYPNIEVGTSLYSTTFFDTDED